MDTFESISQCWPKDWLPLDFPHARICAMNYDTGKSKRNNAFIYEQLSSIYLNLMKFLFFLDSDPYLWRPVWYPKKKRSSLATRAMKMIRVLVDNNIGANNRPIIWIG